MGATDKEQGGMGSWRPPATPALALHCMEFRVVSGEGLGGHGGAGAPRSIQALAPQGVCKYFYSVLIAEADVDSSGLVHEHSFTEVLHTDLQPVPSELGPDLWAFFGEESPAAFAQSTIQNNRSNRNAFKRFHMIPDGSKHAANLVVQSLAN